MLMPAYLYFVSLKFLKQVRNRKYQNQDVTYVHSLHTDVFMGTVI